MDKDMDSPFKDFINKYEECGDGEEVPVLDKVIKSIFTSCNSENDINVPVSKLIEFISPFLQENTEAMNELTLCLNENSTSSNIDFDTFHKCMTEWTQKIYCENNPETTEEQIVDGSKNETESIDEFSCKNCAESTNLSTSLYSNCDTPDISVSEKSQLEYQIQELQHQKRKMDEELTRVRLDLSSTSELNESLQGNLDKLLKKLTNEKKLNEHLVLERKKDEEVQEELTIAKKRIVKLEKSITVYEKQINLLQEQLDNLNSLKQNLEAKIKNTDEKSEEAYSNALVLQSEIEQKNREIISERDANLTLLQQNEEFRNAIEQCTIDIEKVKLEKEKLEKDLQELTERNDCLKCLNRTYNSMHNSFQSNSENDDYEHENSLEMKINESDNYYYSNFHTMFPNGNDTTESLQDEICKATINEANNKDLENNSINQLKNLDTEKKLLRLQCDLIQHENCALIISKQKDEIETISQNNEDYKKQIDNLEKTTVDLKTQLSLSYDRETILQGRCVNLEDNLRTRTAYLSEIQSKLNEYTELEFKYKLLNKKIEELETDNSMKYVKIVNLTVEIEKLRQILAKADEHNTDELSKKIGELEEQRRYNENEKNELLQKIKVLNEEKMNLQIEKEKLLSRILELENQRQKLLNEKDDLYNEKETLQFENFACKSEQETLKMEMKKYQNEKESLEVEKGNLKSENKNLEVEKNELEKRLRNRLEKLERKIDCMEMEKRSLLTDIAMMKQDKDRLQNDLAKIRTEHSDNAELSLALESLRKDHETLTVNYEIAREIERKQEERCEALIIDNTRMVEELANLQTEYQRLSTKNKNLLEENQDLMAKMDKNQTTSKKMDIENKQLSVDLVNLKLNFDKVQTNMLTYEKLNENLHIEKEYLQKSIENKDKEVTLLRQTLQDKQNIVNTVENDMEAIKINENNLKLELKETRAKLMKNVINYEIEKKNMTAFIIELEKKLEDGEKLTETQKESEKQLRADCEDLTNKLRLEVEKHDYLCKKMVDLENELFEEKLNCRKFKEEAEKLSGDISKLKETLTKIENRNDFVEKQNEILDKEKNDLKSIWQECNKKLLTCIRIKSSLAQKNKKLFEENERFSIKCNKLDEDLIKKTQMLDQANKNLSEIWNEMKNTERKISDNEQQRIGLFRKEMTKHKSESDKLKTEVEHLRRERNYLVEKLRIAEKSNEESKIEYEKLLIEKDSWLTEKIEIFKKDISGSFTNKSSSDGRLTPRTNFDRLVVKNTKLEEKLVTERSKNSEKIEQITKLRDENMKLLIEKQKIINDLENSNEDSQKKLSEIYFKVEELNEEIIELKKNNEALLKNSRIQDYNFEVETNDVSKDVKIIELQERLEREVKNSDRNLKCMSIIRDRLYERRLRLARATLHTMKVWKVDLNDDAHMNLYHEGLQEQELDHVSENSLDDEVLKMDYQVNVTAVFLDQLSSMRNHELYKTASPHVTDDLERESIEQDISSNVETKALENMGLSRDFSRLQGLSMEEMEEKFRDIVLAHTLDKASLLQRCRREEDYLKQKQKSMKEEITKLSHRLKELPDGVENSSSLEHIHQVSTEISVSAKQYGYLKQQENLCGVMELMTNYVANLRRKIETISNRCLSTNPSLTKLSPRNNSHRKEKKDDEDDDESITDIVLVEESKSRLFFWQSWTKEMQFILTLSLSVMIAVIFFNVFENSEGRFSPIPPPT